MKRIIAATAVALCAAVLSVPAQADEANKAPDGKTLFTKYKCEGCHSVETASIKRTKPVNAKAAHKPPDLSKVGDQRGHEWIEKWLDKTEKLEGRLHPTIKFKGTKDEREALAAWLETMKSEKTEGASGEAKEAKEEAKEAKEEAKEAKEAVKEVKEELKEHEKGSAADTTGHSH